MGLLTPQFLSTGLLIIDVQRRLIDAMPKSVRAQLSKNITNLVALMKDSGGAIVVTEQYPQGLGPTVDSLADELESVHRIAKTEFNCFYNDTFLEEGLTRLPQHVIVVGIETHICVFQTVVSLLDEGYHVYIPVDAVASRAKMNWQNGIDLMGGVGATITNTETLIFQYLRDSKSERFKMFSELVR